MSNVLIENLQTIKDARDDIKVAIENKGATGITDDITTYANLIDNISGGGSGDIKLFETQEEMQNDLDAHEGDKAVVYRSEINNAQEDSIFSKAVFPNTVILPEAFTGNTMVAYRSTGDSYFDCWGELSQTRFRLSGYGDQGDVRIEYTSEDGVTYTRTDGGDEEVDFGVEVQREAYEEWNDVIGYFIKVDRNTFEGLFEYNYHKTDDYLGIKLSDIYCEEDKAIFPETGLRIKFDDIVTMFNAVLDSGLNPSFNHRNDFYFTILTDESKTNYYFYHTGSIDFGKFNQNQYGYMKSSYFTDDYYGYIYNTQNETITKSDRLVEYTVGSNTIEKFLDNNDYFIGTFHSYANEITNTGSYFYYHDFDNNKQYQQVSTPNFRYFELSYTLTSTQLTLSSPDQLLPGKVAYGKEGVVVGDGSIYNNLDNDTINSTLLGISFAEGFNLYPLDKDTTTPYVSYENSNINSYNSFLTYRSSTNNDRNNWYLRNPSTNKIYGIEYRSNLGIKLYEVDKITGEQITISNSWQEDIGKSNWMAAPGDQYSNTYEFNGDYLYFTEQYQESVNSTWYSRCNVYKFNLTTGELSLHCKLTIDEFQATVVLDVVNNCIYESYMGIQKITFSGVKSTIITGPSKYNWLRNYIGSTKVVPNILNSEDTQINFYHIASQKYIGPYTCSKWYGAMPVDVDNTYTVILAIQDSRIDIVDSSGNISKSISLTPEQVKNIDYRVYLQLYGIQSQSGLVVLQNCIIDLINSKIYVQGIDYYSPPFYIGGLSTEKISNGFKFSKYSNYSYSIYAKEYKNLFEGKYPAYFWSTNQTSSSYHIRQRELDNFETEFLDV